MSPLLIKISKDFATIWTTIDLAEFLSGVAKNVIFGQRKVRTCLHVNPPECRQIPDMACYLIFRQRWTAAPFPLHHAAEHI